MVSDRTAALGLALQAADNAFDPAPHFVHAAGEQLRMAGTAKSIHCGLVDMASFVAGRRTLVIFVLADAVRSSTLASRMLAIPQLTRDMTLLIVVDAVAAAENTEIDQAVQVDVAPGHACLGSGIP